MRTIHLHLIRHTLANEMNRRGVAIVDAAALLGHTPEVYGSTYLRKSEDGLRSAASALGAAFDGRCLEWILNGALSRAQNGILSVRKICSHYVLYCRAGEI